MQLDLFLVILCDLDNFILDPFDLQLLLETASPHLVLRSFYNRLVMCKALIKCLCELLHLIAKTIILLLGVVSNLL